MRIFPVISQIIFVSTSLSFSLAQVSVSPLYEHLEFSDVGQTQTTFSVVNGSTEPIRFRAGFTPFRFSNSGLYLIDDGKTVPGDLSPYLRAAPLEFEVPPSGEQIIRVIALVPPSAVETELRAALVVEPLFDTATPIENQEGGVTGQVTYTYRFIAQIYATQAGTQAQLNIQEPVYNAGRGLGIIYVNRGAVSGIGSTTWELRQDGKVLAASEDASRYIVLPGDTRNGVIAPELELEPGEYTLTGTFGTEDGGEPPIVLNPQPFTKTFTVK